MTDVGVTKKRKISSTSGGVENLNIESEAKKAFLSISDENGLVTLEKFTEWYKTFTKSLNTKAPKVSSADAPQETKLTTGKRASLLRSLVSGLKSSLKKKKFYSSSFSGEEVTGEAVISEPDFKMIFDLYGTAVQVLNPDGTEKKSSVVSSKRLEKTDIDSIFGSLVQGITVPTFSYPRNFCKQYKTGKASIIVVSAIVNYSKNTQNCKIKFSVTTSSGSSSEGIFFLNQDRGDY